jgi:hypothetical protein
MTDRHPFDELAQELREQTDRLAARLRELLFRPVMVGSRRLTPRQQASAFLSLPPDLRQAMAAAGYDFAPSLQAVFDRLGPFGLTLLPYLHPMEPPAAEEPPPTIVPPPVSL